MSYNFCALQNLKLVPCRPTPLQFERFKPACSTSTIKKKKRNKYSTLCEVKLKRLPEEARKLRYKIETKRGKEGWWKRNFWKVCFNQFDSRPARQHWPTSPSNNVATSHWGNKCARSSHEAATSLARKPPSKRRAVFFVSTHRWTRPSALILSVENRVVVYSFLPPSFRDLSPRFCEISSLSRLCVFDRAKPANFL